MAVLSALKYANYRLFITGQGMSNLGNLMHQVAVSWLAYTLTDSAFLLAVITFSQQMAAFFVGFVAGVLADRFNKRTILLGAHFLIGVDAFLLAYLALTDQATVIGLLLLQLFMGLFKGLEMPVRQAFVNDIVEEKKHLTNAIALNSIVFNTARVIGPAIAGLLIPLVGEGYCFFIYGVMSLMIVLFFYLIRYQATNIRKDKLNVWHDIKDGLYYAYEDRPIRVSLLFVAAFSFIGISFLVLLPVLTDRIFQADAVVFGYMTSAMGLGAIAGGIYLGSRNSALRMQRLIALAAFLFAIGLLVVSLSNILWITLGAIAITGIGRVMAFSGTNTLLQTIAAEQKRGRVLSLYISTFMGAITLGSLAVGALADLIGVGPTLMLEAIGCLILALLYVTQLKYLSFATYRRILTVETIS